MSHDIDDLLNLIKELEERILVLESQLENKLTGEMTNDAWYWDH